MNGEDQREMWNCHVQKHNFHTNRMYIVCTYCAAISLDDTHSNNPGLQCLRTCCIILYNCLTIALFPSHHGNTVSNTSTNQSTQIGWYTVAWIWDYLELDVQWILWLLLWVSMLSFSLLNYLFFYYSISSQSSLWIFLAQDTLTKFFHSWFFHSNKM